VERETLNCVALYCDEVTIVEDKSSITLDNTFSSYSSILKRPKQANPPLAAGKNTQAKVAPALAEAKPNPPATSKSKVGEVEEKKKVTTKTPIEFDLLSALTVVRKNKEKKNKATVAGGPRVVASKKAEAERIAVRNALDSSAPLRKRGKEREGGKKKRKTVLKKAILAERARKKELREAAEQRKV